MYHHVHMRTAGRDPDSNSRGYGLALRAAGILVPPVAGAFAAYLAHESWTYLPEPPSGTLNSVLRTIGYVWGWPALAYQGMPLLFVVLGIGSLLFTAVLLARRDWRGAVVVLCWSFAIGWVIAGAARD